MGCAFRRGSDTRCFSRSADHGDANRGCDGVAVWSKRRVPVGLGHFSLSLKCRHQAFGFGCRFFDCWFFELVCCPLSCSRVSLGREHADAVQQLVVPRLGTEVRPAMGVLQRGREAVPSGAAGTTRGNILAENTYP